MKFTQPSPNFYFVYEHDHANRARAFAGDKCQDINQPAKTVQKLDTLVFWGHGTPAGLCGKDAKGIVDVIKKWRALNSKIETVEILTCNSRHAPGGSDPFITKLKNQMGFRLRNVKVKAMPIRMGPGGLHGDSILFADYNSRTWCYMTAPSDRELFSMRSLFKAICETLHGDNAVTTATYLTSSPPRKPNEGAPLNPFSKWAKEIKDIHDCQQIQGWLGGNVSQFMKDFLKALDDDAFRREFIATRKYSMNYGMFETLRSALVTIK
ncbi:MAG: hypothetical protein KIT84_10550 [Labilithrix sp.]|nr:hypothetical protein [Labilithrix sp.]MCW5811445.1 hypothetical protein [Labilithrix sp.]